MPVTLSANSVAALPGARKACPRAEPTAKAVSFNLLIISVAAEARTLTVSWAFTPVSVNKSCICGSCCSITVNGDCPVVKPTKISENCGMIARVRYCSWRFCSDRTISSCCLRYSASLSAASLPAIPASRKLRS